MKDCGILLHISSLPSRYGIGSFGRSAYQFVDFLALAGHKYWQVLPLGHTSYGDSPYQTFSVNAGNPYFIDIDMLISQKLISKEDAATSICPHGYINYGNVYALRSALLKKIKLSNADIREYQEFLSGNPWLNDYALFMSLKNKYGGACWSEWDDKYRLRERDALEEYALGSSDELENYKVQQFLFDKQWKKLKQYANSKGVEIIGDIPIYVAYDSVDVWSRPELFHLDDNRRMIEVAGVPPDYFSADGQLWGNPLYNWDYMERNGFAWWIERITSALSMYDVLRIDHFRGFDSYWAIPYDSVNAKIGEWKRGPALKLFEVVNQRIPGARIIAEDLGEKSPDVITMLKGTGYPGMKILQFGLLGDDDNEHLPKNYTDNYIAYTGTHDNDTAKGWFYSLTKNQQDYVQEKYIKNGEIVWSLIEMVYESNAGTAVIPLQDILELGNEARINIPSTLGGINWCWRLEKLPPKTLAKKLLALATRTNRKLSTSAK